MKFASKIKKILVLVASCCPLIGAERLFAQELLAISPPAPEAYQSFVLTFSVCTFPAMPDHVDIDTSADSITVKAADTAILCSPQEKIARVEGLPSGSYSIKFSNNSFVENNEFGEDDAPWMLGNISVASAPATQKVRAFYNSQIKHYFLSADSAERDSLLSGGGGGGWAFADKGFNAWPAAGPAPAAAKPVCRFYSAVVNSHFYTAGPNECELLKQPGSGWTYEGIAFRALVPTKGSCYPGTTPVWRLYNDRFAQADSNHRFVASPDTYRHMMANGWIGEGVAFCSPES
jgi:hypothetical protein